MGHHEMAAAWPNGALDQSPFAGTPAGFSFSDAVTPLHPLFLRKMTPALCTCLNETESRSDLKVDLSGFLFYATHNFVIRI